MAQTKATKKFEKKHLPDVLRRRKESKKIKQKEQKKAKRKERAREDAGHGSEEGEGTAPKSTGNALTSMSVDDFFAGGFEVPKDPKASKNRKRKRTPPPAGPDSSPDNVQLPIANDDSGAELESDEDEHKKQLAALADTDPEFYKHLQEHDPDLLDFDDEVDLEALNALSDSEEDTPKKKRKTKSAEAGQSDEEDVDVKEVKLAQVQKWAESMAEKKSLRAAKEVVIAFRAATHINEEEPDKFKYKISNPDVYHALLSAALKNIPPLLLHLIPVKEKAGGRIHVSTEGKHFKNVTPLIKTFLNSIEHLLENLSDPATLKTTLSAVNELLPYALSHKKLVKQLTKTIVEIWSDATNTEATRISAFLVLRRLTVIGDPGIREMVLRATYQGLVKGSRNTTIHTIQGINLMKNSAADLWGIDASIGYTTGFTFIRQLAIHLRSSITNRSKESYKTVYNWQYVHSLDFWSRVLSTFCDSLREAESGKESPLRPLIYPFVQVTMGALRLIPTSQYFPLRFQLIRSLLRISLATGTYIPMAAPLYEVLNSAEMRKPPKASTLKALDFSINIRAPASYLKTRIYQDGVGEQVVELFAEFLVQWAKSIAFPELAIPITVMLKRWLKDMMSKINGNKNGKVNGMIGLLVQKIEANCKWIEEKRSKVDFAPKNRAGVESFLKDIDWEKSPLGAYVVTQRRTREEKAKLVEQARKDSEKDRKKGKDSRIAEEIDGMEIDGEDDEEDDGEETPSEDEA